MEHTAPHAWHWTYRHELEAKGQPLPEFMGIFLNGKQVGRVFRWGSPYWTWQLHDDFTGSGQSVSKEAALSELKAFAVVMHDAQDPQSGIL